MKNNDIFANKTNETPSTLQQTKWTRFSMERILNIFYFLINSNKFHFKL